MTADISIFRIMTNPFLNLRFLKLRNVNYNGSKTAHTYQNIYQYNGAGFGDALFTAGTSPVVGVNKFTARDNEKLTACGVYVPAANCSVKVQVYQDQSNKSLVSKKYTAQNAGFYTIPFGSSSFDMEKGKVYRAELQISSKKKEGPNIFIRLNCRRISQMNFKWIVRRDKPS